MKSIRHSQGRRGWWGVIAVLGLAAGAALWSQGDDLDDMLDRSGDDEPKDSPLAELTKEMGGGTLFRFAPVDRPEDSLADRLFWREYGNYLAVQSAPVRLWMDGKEIIAPRTVQNPRTLELSQEYPVAGRKLVAAASEHVLTPGNLRLKYAGKLVADHPALQIAGDEVRILCAPVRLEAVDAEGRPVPANLRVAWENSGLLREEGSFNPLILWLPVGCAYKSTLGSFRLTPAGKVEVEPGALAAGVTQTPDGLRLTAPAKEPARPAAPATLDAGKLWLLAHRGRSVFAWNESAIWTVFVPRGFAGGEGRVLCAPRGAAGAPPLALGSVPLPAVSAANYDSRPFELRLGAVPPGAYDLWVECGAARSKPLALEVVPWFERSPFFVHSRSACIDLWPTSDEGFKTLRGAGLEMGADTPIDALMPGLDSQRLAACLKDPALGPPESAYVRSSNDNLLERMLRYQLRSVELIVYRAAGFYNEGLSYHHSYKPSVDRMIRRMHVFSQQTADYPSYWGVNYSWFPAMFGYAEAGVPTDAHVYDRNVALAANLARAGYTNAPRDQTEWYHKNKFSADPATREKADAIRHQVVRFWKAQLDFGFGQHNKLYNDAIRQVRPDMAFTLFENAGHDAMKRTRSLFNDMNASCYESYTDYGEWAMSTSFTTDWARGNAPERPVWITTDWGTSSEGMMKSLFHGFGRGLAGGGVPMTASGGFLELQRRGKGQRFVSQYGAIARRATPDRRFAILATDAQQVFNFRAPFVYHAVYYHLTRLGFPPIILDEPTVTEKGIPEGVRVLVLVREESPLEPAVEKAIAAFRQRGGKVAYTADSLVKPEGAVAIDAKVQSIWSLGGFEWNTHVKMWEEFETNWRAPLTKALAELGVPAAATTDPDQGLAVTLDAGPVRYAVVIADKRDTHFSIFEPTEGLPVSFEGAGWIVRDLAKQVTLPGVEKDGRTEVMVDLITEPTTVLALYRSAPAGVAVEATPAPALGGTLAFRGNVMAADGSALGPVPVTCTVLDPQGKERLTVYRAAGDVVEFPLAALDAPGAWSVKVQELLTGLTATAPLTVGPAQPVPAVVSVPDVHVVNEASVREVAARPGEKLVIVEPSRRALLPLAGKLAAALTAAGVPARVWEVKPEEFTTVPTRYYPRASETNELAMIDAGRLIGFRQGMKPFIDTKARANVPERGGYEEIQPYFMVGRDCIVFSGGPLAESLRAVSPWINTPTVPGRGQGRILAVFSPFMADRHVLALLANDPEGLSKAADRLVALLGQKPQADDGSSRSGELKPVAAPVAPAAVAQPYLAYTPLRRVQRLLASADGRAAALLSGRKDNLALVDAAGKVTGTVALPTVSAPALRLDGQGRVWNYAFNTRPESGPATVMAQCVRPDGTLEGEWLAFEGSPRELGPHAGAAAFPVAPDGRTAAFGRLGGMLLGDLQANKFFLYDDAPWVKKTFEVWTPRFPVAMAFSPDSRYLFFTMDTRPTGYENMHQELNFPEGAESVLVDATTGKRVWALRGTPSQYATFNGFAAVAEDGVATAFVDVWGHGYVVDKAGKFVFRGPVEPTSWYNGFVTAPRNGVGTWIAANGKLAAFGFKDFVALVEGANKVRINGTNFCSAAVSRDGAFAVTGWDDGTLRAFSGSGEPLWTVQPGGVGPHLAALADGQTLVGTSEGDLVWLDRKGAEVRRVNVAAVADRERRPLARAAEGAAPRRVPFVYRDPSTLETAIARLGAKKTAEWKPAGAGREAYGRTFHALTESVELAGPAAGEAFVHVVYRRPPENKSMKVVILTGPKREEFVLDKPAPEYRVVDIPFRGPEAKVVVEAQGAAEAAEISIWSLTWPGPNVAYVKPPDTGASAGMDLLSDTRRPKEETGGMELDIEEDGGGTYGRMKECDTWSPNPDIDKVSGMWLVPPVNGLLVVNGARFDTGAWGEGKKFVGEWLTEKFGASVQISLAATYDHSHKQSGVTENLAVFHNDLGGGRAQGGDVLGAAIGNDQFWRLFSFPPTKVTLFGAYVYTPGAGPEGLSEVEAYR